MFTAFGLAVAVLWAAIAYGLHATQREATDRASAEGRNLARSLAEHVGASVRSVDLSLQHLRDEWVRDTKVFGAAVARQHKIIEEESVIQVSVIDAGGRVSFSNLPGWTRVDLSDREHFVSHKGGDTDRLHVSAPVLGRLSKQWTIQFTRPIYDRRQQFAGVLVFSVPPPALEQAYKDIELGEGSIIGLTRSDGQILAYSRDLAKATAISAASAPGVRPDSPPAGDYRRASAVDGVERLFSYRKVTGYPMVVIVGQDVKTILAPYHRQRTNYLFAGVLMTALLLALTLLLVARQRAEHTDQRNRAQLAAIVANSDDAIYSHSLDRAISSWNAGAERLFGYTAPEVLGKDISLLVPSDCAQEFERHSLAINQGRPVPPFQTVRLGKGGRRIDVSIGASPVRDDAGALTGIAVIARDMTERRRAEEALRESEERLQRALEGSQLALWDYDFVTGSVYLSETWSELLGGPREPTLTTFEGLISMVPEEDRPRINAEMLRAIKGQRTSYHVEHRVQTRAGDTIWVLSTGRVVARNANGRALRAIGTNRDVTERKIAALREATRAEAMTLIATGAPLPRILDVVVRGVEAENASMLCSILLLDESGTRLLTGAAPNLPGFYNDAINGLGIGPAVGSCGTAAYTRQCVFTEDIQTDPNWVGYREVAARAGLRSCWSEPIRGSDDRMLGTFAIYFHEPRAPSEGDHQTLAGAASIAAIAIEKKRADDALRTQTERLRLGQSTARLIVVDWDVRTDQLTWSDSPQWLRGPLPEGGEYPPYATQVHAEDRERFLAARAKAFETQQGQTLEYRLVRTDEQVLWLRSQQTVSAYADGKPAQMRMALLDITDYKRAQLHIEFLAHQDSLTALPNRALFKDRMEQAMAHSVRDQTKVAVLFLDLDSFKTINDSLGHASGDELLRAVARGLQDCVRETDTVSRQGGDEFLILLAGLPDADVVMPVVDKLMKRFKLPFEVEGEQLNTSASIGIAVYPEDGKDFETLLKSADMAMYKAKDAGKNTYRFYDNNMNIEAVEHLRIRNGLRAAIENREFILHYQPQIDLRTGAVVGAEALIRWNHPEHGTIPPGRFIHIAEDTGLIVPIGDWVLNEACRQMAAWRKAGLPEIVVAVNLSAVQFRRSDLEQAVVRALEESGLEPAMLELELTESIMIHDTETTLATVRRLKALGVKLSIDDFGTGYSSLSYLKRFAVDKLKIDQSFVRDLAVDPEDAAIVQAIIQMAISLGLRTVAEGVEDESSLNYLRLNKCDEAQGYHFAKPMAATEFASYVLQASSIRS